MATTRFLVANPTMPEIVNNNSLSVIMDAARMVALAAVMCFFVFGILFFTPEKKACASEQELDEQLLPVRRKKSGRAKRSKKSRNEASRALTDLVSEEDSEETDVTIVQVAASDGNKSDIMQGGQKDEVAETCDKAAELLEAAVKSIVSKNKAEEHQHEQKRADEEKDAADSYVLDPGATDENRTCESAEGSVVECDAASIWGCQSRRIYSSSLLLAHLEIQRVIAKGAPGLEPPSSEVASPNLGLCSLKVR